MTQDYTLIGSLRFSESVVLARGEIAGFWDWLNALAGISARARGNNTYIHEAGGPQTSARAGCGDCAL